jgi:hypothetical protein
MPLDALPGTKKPVRRQTAVYLADAPRDHPRCVGGLPDLGVPQEQTVPANEVAHGAIQHGRSDNALERYERRNGVWLDRMDLDPCPYGSGDSRLGKVSSEIDERAWQ